MWEGIRRRLGPKRVFTDPGVYSLSRKVGGSEGGGEQARSKRKRDHGREGGRGRNEET